MTLASRSALAEPASAPSLEPAPAAPPPLAPTPAPIATIPPTVTPSGPAPSPVAPSPVAPTAVAPSPDLSGTARIRIAVDYADAWLETRPFGGDSAWQRGCAAPCGQSLLVEGVELRVVAADMTPTKPFRVDTGSGTALLSVDGGSAAARAWGRVSFAVGVPVALLGMTGFALGSFDDRSGLKTAGAVSLGVGAALVLVALPLLVRGSTSVKNAKGDSVATARASDSF